MAEAIFLLGLASPFLLMIWLTAARRKAQRSAQDHEQAEAPAFSAEAFTEEEAGADGLSYGRRYDGDSATLPPDDQSGEVGGIKALQGRR